MRAGELQGARPCNCLRFDVPCKNSGSLSMLKPRTFVSAPPNGWISRERLLIETGIGERALAGWVAQLGLKTCLVSRGKRGFESYYPPESIGTIKRLRELRTESPRNFDEWLWRAMARRTRCRYPRVGEGTSGQRLEEAWSARVKRFSAYPQSRSQPTASDRAL